MTSSLEKNTWSPTSMENQLLPLPSQKNQPLIKRIGTFRLQDCKIMSFGEELSVRCHLFSYQIILNIVYGF